MSGLGGGRPGGGSSDWAAMGQARQGYFSASSSASDIFTEKIAALNKHIEKLTKRVEELETAYMELKLLGKEDAEDQNKR